MGVSGMVVRLVMAVHELACGGCRATSNDRCRSCRSATRRRS